jgi:predicted nucleic acid-binding protein
VDLEVSFNSLKPGFLDASAAGKLVLKEHGADRLLKHFNPTGSFFIASLCLFEALGVLKRMMLKKEIVRDHYFRCCFLLLTYVNRKRLRIDEPEISSYETFRKAEKLARQYSLDLSDALQPVGLKYGRFSHFVQESKPVLITADRALEAAARSEGLRVWNCEETERPLSNET